MHRQVGTVAAKFWGASSVSAGAAALEANSPYRYYWNQLRIKMMMARRHVIFKKHVDEDDSAVTLDRLLGWCLPKRWAD